MKTASRALRIGQLLAPGLACPGGKPAPRPILVILTHHTHIFNVQDTDMPEEVEKLLAKFDKLWAKVGRLQLGAHGCCRPLALQLPAVRPVRATSSASGTVFEACMLAFVALWLALEFCSNVQPQVLARSDGELGGVTAADREAVEAARQALREAIEEYCLIDDE